MNRTIFTLGVAWKMLPLVSRIAKDIAETSANLKVLRKQRKATTERKQQWTLDDEIKDGLRKLRDTNDELDSLSIVMLDPKVGKVGYPTIVNNTEAYFTWQPGEPTFLWQFAGDNEQHSCPKEWLKEIPTT